MLDIISKEEAPVLVCARSAARTWVREEGAAGSASPSGMVPDILRWWPPKLLRVLPLR